MAVHARQGKLDRRDPALASRLEQGRPRAGHGTLGGIDGGEVQLGEHHVEAGQERLVLERRVGNLLFNGAGDRQVEVVEPGHAILRRQRALDRRHPGHDLGYRPQSIVPGPAGATLHLPILKPGSPHNG